MSKKMKKKPAPRSSSKRKASPAADYARAARLVEAGDGQGALAVLDALVERDAGASHILYLRGRVHHDLGDLAAARRDLDRSLELAPDDTDALNQRALLRSQTGDHAGARADLRRALEDGWLEGPARALLQCSLAEVHAAAGSADLGLAALERAIALDPVWRREAPGLASLAPLRADPRWKAVLAGERVFWLDDAVLVRLRHRRVALDEEERRPAALGGTPVPGPLGQLFACTWTARQGVRKGSGPYTCRGLTLGLTDLPTPGERAAIGGPARRPWVVWGRGPLGELVVLALDDPSPGDPEVHLVRPAGSKTHRSKAPLSRWLAHLVHE